MVAANHAVFCGPERLAELVGVTGADTLLVDPWNCFSIAQVFSYTGEAAALAGAGSWSERQTPHAS